MRNINKIVLLIFSIIIFSCSNNGKPSPRAIHLNDKAMEILMENGDMSEEQIDEGLRLLDEATTIEPDYQLAYWNKMSFLFKKKDYNRLLETNQETINLLEITEVVVVTIIIAITIVVEKVMGNQEIEKNHPAAFVIVQEWRLDAHANPTALKQQSDAVTQQIPGARFQVAVGFQSSAAGESTSLPGKMVSLGSTWRPRFAILTTRGLTVAPWNES